MPRFVGSLIGRLETVLEEFRQSERLGERELHELVSDWLDGVCSQDLAGDREDDE